MSGDPHVRWTALATALTRLLVQVGRDQVRAAVLSADAAWYADLPDVALQPYADAIVVTGRIHDRILRLLAYLRVHFPGRGDEIDRLAGAYAEYERLAEFVDGSDVFDARRWLPDVPVGPLVPRREIAGVLAEAFARQEPLHPTRVRQRSQELLAQYHSDAPYLRAAQLPNLVEPLVPYWHNVLASVGIYGPRALTALLCALPDPFHVTPTEVAAAELLLSRLHDRLYERPVDDRREL